MCLSDLGSQFTWYEPDMSPMGVQPRFEAVRRGRRARRPLQQAHHSSLSQCGLQRQNGTLSWWQGASGVWMHVLNDAIRSNQLIKFSYILSSNVYNACMKCTSNCKWKAPVKAHINVLSLHLCCTCGLRPAAALTADGFCGAEEARGSSLGTRTTR